MTVKTIIAKYNGLNGKEVTIKQLQNMRKQAKGVHTTIYNKLGKALSQLKGSERAIIEISKPIKPPSATKTRTKKPDTLSGIDEGFLHGLEYIQDDSDLDGQTLGGTDSVYDIITKSIIKIINKKKGKDEQRWRKSKLYFIDGLNFHTKKYYSGINWITLSGPMGGRLEDSPYFLTMNQANKLKGKVKKGADSYPVFYFTFVHKDKEGKTISADQWEGLPSEEQGDKFPSPRYYKVFNSDDIEGIDFGLPEEPESIEFEQIDTAEKIVNMMPKRPPIFNKGSRAYYMPSKDTVTLPERTRFDEAGHYYSTLFHELIHSTAHKSRIGRPIENGKGTRGYAYEELIAELGAAFLNSHAGLKYFKLEGKADYIQSYNKDLIGRLQKDNKYILKAAAAAQKAANFILAGKDYRLTEFKKSETKPEKNKIADNVKERALFIRLEEEMKNDKTIRKDMSFKSEEDAATFAKDLNKFSKNLRVNIVPHNKKQILIRWVGATETKTDDSKISEKVISVTLAPGLTISSREIPYNIAFDAHRGTSFSPEKRAISAQKSFVTDLQNDFDSLLKKADNEDKKQILIDEFIRYKEGYKKRYLAYLSSKSRVMSSMIVGPSNFPIARNNKANNVVDKRLNELIDYSKKAYEAIEKRINPPIPKIVSGSSDALQRLEDKLKELESAQEKMKAANKIIRSGKNVVEKLKELGLSDKVIAEIQQPDWSGKKGFQSFYLTNNGAMIRDTKKRIEREKKTAVKAADGNKEREVNGIKIIENFEANRLQLVFDGKPEPAIIAELKKNGYRWSPRFTAWQRQLTNNAKWGLKYLSFFRDEEFKPEEKPAAKPEQLSLELAGLNGFTRLDESPTKPDNVFTLPGTIGKWLGEQQRYRLVISLDGETHAGKSELAKQIVNSMASHGFKIAWFDLEQGGLSSKDTVASFARNVDPANNSKIYVIGEAANGIDTIKEYAANDSIDVIAIDSATKLNANNNAWMEELRTQYPNKIWVTIWQQNAQGGTRGGSSINFDAPVHIKVYRPDKLDYHGNYAEFLKNRGNSTDMRYMVANKIIVDLNKAKDES